MTREEVKLILATIAEVFPKNLMTTVTAQTVNIWAQMLDDMDYKRATIALAHWIQTQKYPPTIADLRELTAVQTTTNQMTAEQAWGKLQDAIRKFGYTMPKEAAEYLGEEIWTIVNRFGYNYFCQMPVDEASTYFAHFRNAYNGEVKKQNEQARLSPSVRIALDGMKQQNRLGDGNG